MPITDPEAPVVPTTEKKQGRLKRQFKRDARQTIQQLVRTHKQFQDALFENRSGLTPQEAFDALGTQAKDAIQFTQAIKTLVNGTTGETTIDTSELPGLTINPDGTVTMD